MLKLIIVAHAVKKIIVRWAEYKSFISFSLTAFDLSL